jgi:hypothetical protein
MAIQDYLLESKLPSKTHLLNEVFTRTIADLKKNKLYISNMKLSYRHPILTITLPTNTRYTMDKKFSMAFQKQYKAVFKRNTFLTMKSVSFSRNSLEVHYNIL